MAPVVETKDLQKFFVGRDGSRVRALDRVNLTISAGETLALIGESGCGKSTFGRVLVGLLEPSGGDVAFLGKSISTMSRREHRELRAATQVVFQEPFQSLDPRMRIDSIVREPLDIQGTMRRTERVRRVKEAMDLVGLHDDLARRLPAQLSGGQQQRVGIARAIVGTPKLVVLDEPTASLDRAIRQQVADLLLRLQKDLNLAFLLITHDMGSVRKLATRCAVLYRGTVVELGTVAEVLDAPRHPYTRALVSSELPPIVGRELKQYKLRISSDRPPISGCPLANTCPLVEDACRSWAPELLSVSPGHESACRRWQEVAEDVAVEDTLTSGEEGASQ